MGHMAQKGWIFGAVLSNSHTLSSLPLGHNNGDYYYLSESPLFFPGEHVELSNENFVAKDSNEVAKAV